MVVSWNKAADWLPYSNAIAQVQFWQGDLIAAETYLKYVESFKKYNLSGYVFLHGIAVKDIGVSKKGLEAAKKKLIETKAREKKK